MSRASWKGPVKNQRSTSITPAHVNKTFAVHNGRTFISVKINSDRIGHKLGELAITKIPAKYSR